ncbi:ABC transporter permease [Clostridium hydrogeniformans]|uniref:ABC transporter permease n=1 Tax=Clostridium hydrogeniformans TaxID=349933 RepID=UPI0004871EA1|nr:ABC transporter permease [Clostridium hydrogeniformans]
MTFSSIIRKNFTYNFNKYISFYFVNSLIIAMLFMYGSLIYNPTIINDIGKTSVYETVKMALMGIIIFSIIFITYTNLSFLKNRGKEFGMYLTLGMTTKDLTKLIFVENLGVMVASLATGILSGALFGRLFYMGLNKILVGSNILYKLNYKSFLLSVGIFVLIFLGNVIFNIFYIRRVSIIDAIKADKKKEVGKTNNIIGFVSLVLLIVSLYCLPKTLLKEIFKNQYYMTEVFIGLIIVSTYVVIGSLIVLVKGIFSKSSKAYNRNLLVLSNLSHRFLAYKNILYMLSLLVAGAMFFVGYSYSMYSSTVEYVSMDNPYDIMFVETSEYNKVEKNKVEEVIGNGKVEKYKVLEYLEVPVFREDGDSLLLWSNNQPVISKSNYNKHMGENVEIKSEEAINITIYNEKRNYEYPSSILTAMDEKQSEKIRNITVENDYKLSKEEYEKILGKNTKLKLEKNNIKEEKGIPFTNRRDTKNYSLGTALVVSDKEYEVLKKSTRVSSIKKLHLINVNNGEEAFDGLISYLRDENGLDNSYWNEGSLSGLTSNDERGDKESYRPVYKGEILKLRLNDNGMILFTMMFIGLLFILANGIVLYYKVLSDIEHEKERITSLNRIGVLEREIKSIISKELAITFFMPIFIGGGLGIYFLYVMVSNWQINGLLIKKAIVVLLIGAIIQGIVYLISRKKYIKEMVK